MDIIDVNNIKFKEVTQKIESDNFIFTKNISLLKLVKVDASKYNQTKVFDLKTSSERFQNY